MAKFVTFLLFMVSIAVLLCLSHGLPTPDEERYLDKEYNRELANLLSALEYAPQYNNPCKYYGSAKFQMPKRNSELINSLLSLPKGMNDAGK